MKVTKSLERILHEVDQDSRGDEQSFGSDCQPGIIAPDGNGQIFTTLTQFNQHVNRGNHLKDSSLYDMCHLLLC